MPDYNLEPADQMEVKIYGKILNEAYMHILFNHQELPLETVFLLDRVQKGMEISKEAADFLRKQKMIEGRYPKIYLSAVASSAVGEAAKYIRNKAFNDQYYKDLIISYITEYKQASKTEIRELLWDKLPDVLTDTQKENKIGNLLSSLRRKRIITTRGTSQQKIKWILVE